MCCVPFTKLLSQTETIWIYILIQVLTIIRFST
jgi:hypothetical protein